MIDVFLTQSTQIGHLDVFNVTPVVEEEVILACSKEYFEKWMQGADSFESVVEHNFISYRKDQLEIRQWFRHHFSKPKVSIRDVSTVDSHDAVIMAIKNNIGLAVVASHLIVDHLESGTIKHIRTAKKENINSISLLKLNDKVPTYTEKVFEKYLVKSIETMITPNSSTMKIPTR